VAGVAGVDGNGRATRSTWAFLTNHGNVLVCIERDPGIRLRDVAASVGITERAAQSIVADLVDAGYLSRQRVGRRNRYAVHLHGSLRTPLDPEQSVERLVRVLREDGSGVAAAADTVVTAQRGTA
jgi:predicted DNA-binding transcriptional regulator